MSDKKVSGSGAEEDAVENDVEEVEDELTRLRQQLHRQLQEVSTSKVT